MRAGASGSEKRIVPSATSRAPHAISSSASCPVVTPPIPTIGRPRRRVTRVHRCERDGLQRRTGKTARRAREHRLQRARIERSSTQRVDQRETVCAHVGDRGRDRGDVRVCGGKLGVERDCGHRTAGGDDLRRTVRGLVDVRAREVQLDRGDVLECCACVCVVRRAEPADGDPERHAELAQTRQLVVEETFAAGIRKSDRIQHSVRGLCDPHGRVAFARQRRDRLGDESVERTRDVGSDERVEAAGRVKQPH